MDYFWIATLLVIGFSAAAKAEIDDSHINGENGWYVPKSDGSFEWIDKDDYATAVKNEDTELKPMLRIDLNAVHFYLYTLENPNEPQIITDTHKSIRNSNFNISNPTKFVIHGWLQNEDSNMNDKIRNVWLKNGAYNIIIVEWSRARLGYIQAAYVVPSVAEKVATMLDYLAMQFNMPLDDLEIIGHSLGAHVAGYAAKYTKSGQIFKIVGLDPALPLFSYKHTDERLCSDDAYYVESIQTNGGKLGFKKPIGKSAFYPNGGESQPGCFLDITGACSHARSIDYYVESVDKNNFPAVKCNTYKEAVKGKCGSTYSSIRMNAMSNVVAADGQFYVPVNKKSPFGLGD